MADGALIDINRFPVKSLSVDRLETCRLTPGAALPADRRFAFAKIGTQPNPFQPEWRPKAAFHVMVTEARMGSIGCRYDETADRLAITLPDGEAMAGQGTDPDFAIRAGQLVARHLGLAPARAPMLVRMAESALTDKQRQMISVSNLASARRLARDMDLPEVDPLRFRNNLLIDLGTAWMERDLIGRRLRIGDTVLEVVTQVIRCAATEIHPGTDRRDLKIVQALTDHYGHKEFGVFTVVIEGGEISRGMAVTID
jgi:uncharacterized protein YcbX